MMDDFIGTYGNNLIVAVVGVGVALLILAIVLWLIRRRSGSAPFIRGGRNRQPRLQVLDATAVDARRRLVLVRRDNVEHLVMIGGPTDIVIESGIGAIPIVRDVQEPELKALPRQESEAKKGEAIIQQERRASLPQQAATASVSIPEEPARQTQRPEPIAPSAPPAPAPRPASVVATPGPASPRPSTPPQPQPHPQLQPQSTPSVTARQPAPPVKQASPDREAPRPTPPPIPVVAPTAAILPMATAPVETPAARTEPSRVDTFVSTPAPIAPPVAASPKIEPKLDQRTAEPAPPVFAAREPVVDQSIAADFLDAARDRVLPDLKSAQPPSPAPFPPKPETPAVAPSGPEPKFSDELASDFESFLEAEIAKSKEAENEPSASVAAEKPVKNQPAPAPVTGAVAEGDMQKEMARIFGELSVTRDR